MKNSLEDFAHPNEGETPFKITSPPWYKLGNLEDISPQVLEEITKSAFQLLEKKFPNYKPRKGQMAMAIDIVDKIFEQKNLVLEAGTGIGKTFAYLIPTLIYSYLSGTRALIITETKNLQVQILEKDLPCLSKVLNINEDFFSLALGSQNYLCRLRYEEFLKNGNPLDFLDKENLEKFNKWALEVFSSKDQFGHLFEKESFWPKSIIRDTCRDSEGCPAQKCGYFAKCNYYRARKKWESSRVVVANTHLFFYHILNEKKILPSFSLIVVDEAHGFLETAYSILTTKYEKNQFSEMKSQANRYDKKLTFLAHEKLLELQELWEKTELLWKELFQNAEIETGLVFEENKSKTIQNLEYQGEKLKDGLAELAELYAELEKETEDSYQLNYLRGMTKRLKDMRQFALNFSLLNLGNYVYWAEKTENKFFLCYSPVEISKELWEKIEETCIFTSATLGHWPKEKKPDKNTNLAKKGYFINFSKQIFGEEEPASVFFNQYPSPFAYDKQCVLYIPFDMQPPEYGKDLKQSKEYEEKLFQDILALTNISQGGCLILFTNNYLLEQTTKFLLENSSFPIYSQSELGAVEALNRFRLEKNGILLGVNSFWQGVDLPGSKLRLLVITKLMFQPPDDPLFKARCEILEKKGGNPFRDLSLPLASIMLRQGFGRLIRSEKDKGVVAILDSRMLTRNYGKVLLANLPKVSLVHSLESLKQKIQELKLFAEEN